ncbi:MAG: hypothetical protein M5U13_08975 [Thermoanaerobaculia bacterium]|nr:hypothetical protein [Thermoanaerobaculia bacterium]
MTPDPPRTRGEIRAEILVALALTLAAALFFLALGALRHPLAQLAGDEGTYLAMATSLARDGDLRFGEADRAWAESHPSGPVTLILQQTGEGIAYSKPVAYALWGAPFVALAGEWGLAAANAAALALGLVAGWAWLRRRADRGRAALVLATFAGAGAIVPQVAWWMTEALQVGLALAGLALALGRARSATGDPGFWGRLLERPWALPAGAVLLGLLASLRDPNLLIALLPAAFYALERSWRRAFGALALTLATLAAVLALTAALGGARNPYRAVRASFDAASGYPAGPGAAAVMEQFDRHRATQTLRARPRLEPERSAVATLTFFAGRHTGLLVYFPFVIALLTAALRRPDRLALVLLAGAAASAGFYLVWMPGNYFGGEGFVGNRYILPVLALLLLAPARLPGRLAIAAAWGVALVAGGSAALSVARHTATDPWSQSHAHAGLFRLLPYESTAGSIAGRRDRYWSGDFLRFVDPFAEVGPDSFRIFAGREPAEVVVATYWPGTPLRFLVAASGPGSVLEVSDWAGHWELPLTGPEEGERRQVLAVEPSRAWRRHSYWWTPDLPNYRVRALRFALRSASGDAEATLRYLGRGAALAEIHAAELLAGELPARGVAGGTARLDLAVRNTGGAAWSSQTPIPVLWGYRFVAEDGKGAGEARAALPREVPPGEELRQELEVGWPQRPGRYRLEVDLVREDLAWFGDAGAGPLLSGDVEVVPGAP